MTTTHTCGAPALHATRGDTDVWLEPDTSPLGIWAIDKGVAHTLTRADVLAGVHGRRTHVCPPAVQATLFGGDQ